MSEPSKYLLDADLLVSIRLRKDSKELYDGVIALAEKGVVKTVRQVFDELPKVKQANEILAPHKAKFVIPTAEQYCADVSGYIETLGNQAGYLWHQTGGKNPDPADPWLVAVARHYGYTLVTNESRLSTMKIPAACKAFGDKCRCISGPHFLYEVGLVTELKPEHIASALFFSKDA